MIGVMSDTHLGTFSKNWIDKGSKENTLYFFYGRSIDETRKKVWGPDNKIFDQTEKMNRYKDSDNIVWVVYILPLMNGGVFMIWRSEGAKLEGVCFGTVLWSRERWQKY